MNIDGFRFCCCGKTHLVAKVIGKEIPVVNWVARKCKKIGSIFSNKYILFHNEQDVRLDFEEEQLTRTYKIRY